MSDLGDFFSLIGEEKKKKQEKQQELIGDLSLGDLFASLSEEKAKIKKKKDKLSQEAKAFESFLFSEPKKEVDTTDWRDNYKPLEVESVNIIEPEPLVPAPEPEIVEESVEELETLAKIRDDLDVKVDKSNNLLKSIEILDKMPQEEKIDDEKDSEVNRLRREIDQLRKMVYETVRQTSTIGGGGAGFIKDLDDVSIAGIQSGYVLIWDEPNNKWVPRPKSEQVDLGPLQAIAGTAATTIINGSVLAFDAPSGQFIATSQIGAATTNIAGYTISTDVPQNNDLIIFKAGDSEWGFDSPFQVVDLSDGTEDGNQDFGSFAP